MKTLLALLCIFVSLRTVGAPFRNLGFDEATTNNLIFNPQLPGMGIGPISDLLPGWELLSGTAPLSSIGFNLFTGGLNYASLYDRNAIQPYPVEGRYSLGLIPGPDFNTGATIQYTLTQTGDLTPDSKLIRFVDVGSPFELRVNGDLVPLVYNSFDVGTSIAFGDISAYAGQEVTLEFTTVQRLSFINGIDSISFVIPEASSWILLSFGSIVLVASQKVFRR